MRYVVDTFNGIAGESFDFDNLKDAEKCFDKEVAYRKERNLKFEFIELYTIDDNDNKIETLKEVYG